ncbi:MAG: glycosyltransferase family 4 protein [Treponema sp.]|nr:glycosyltransferase family 4 protein [Treponema sp.]
MNILFLTLSKFSSSKDTGMYPDLLREFIKLGHHIYILASIDKYVKSLPIMIEEDGCTIIRVVTGKIQKSNILKKGINTILIEYHFLKAIKCYLSNIKIDFILYPTPPITFVNVVNYIKTRDNAKTYLILKDIFPQNAVDLDILKKTGLKGIIYKYFRAKEKKLYSISDKIGCMSPANRQYLLEHNPEIPSAKVEVCPNCCHVKDISLTDNKCLEIRKKYNLPIDKKIFVYGGNLGRPQGIPFIIDCLRSQLNNPNDYFLIVGNGTEFHKLQEFFLSIHPKNMQLVDFLPRDDFDHLLTVCDVGLIFLDYRFTIPNFPSRLLSYLQAGLPVLACTDPVTDLGKIIEENHLGWSCPSNSVEEFSNKVAVASSTSYDPTRSILFIKSHYDAKLACDIISRTISVSDGEKDFYLDN